MISLTRRRSLVAGATLAAGWPLRRAHAAPTIRIGVLEDMSGPYSEIAGPGCVGGAKLAAEDFAREQPGIAVEVIPADMQTKPDLAVDLTREMFDTKGVDMVLGFPSSAAALAVVSVAKQKNKVALITDAGTADLTGKSCGPNHIHWTWDTYQAVTVPVREFLRQGRKSFFFIAPDYALGTAMIADGTAVITASGGKVLGTIRHPFPGTTDFSSYLLQAQAAQPDVVIVASAGHDAQNTVRQAAEFGLFRKGLQMTAPLLLEPDVHAVGLETCQGLVCSTSFYWDRNAASRAFAERMKPYVRGVPVQNHAGAYSATLNYLHAVAALGVDKSKADGRAVVAQLKAVPTRDPLFGVGQVRADGRAIHDTLALRVKAPPQSHGPWDLFEMLSIVPGDQAFRPISAGGCKAAEN
jgi:branched-chain amino acid transport system substrate-binding protein